MDRKQVILSAINNPPPGQADAIVLALEAAGYVIVPKEPSAAMIEAGDAGIDSDCKLECSPERIYRAMVAAYQ